MSNDRDLSRFNYDVDMIDLQIAIDASAEAIKRLP